MKHWLTWAGLILFCISECVAAGVVFREKRNTESSEEGMNSHLVSQVMAEGSKFKTLIEESSNPMIPKGAYFLYTGGDITYLVNPAAKTIARIDRAETLNMVSKVSDMDEQQKRMGMKRETVEVKLEQKLDEAGPTMLGLPTRHYRYVLSYTEKQSAPGMRSPISTKTEEQHEFWATDALAGEAAIAAWQKDQMAEDAGESDAAVQQEENRMYAHGFILKHIITAKIKMSMPGMMMPGMGGGSETERSNREILELRRETIPASVFELPKGYAETELFSPGASDMPDLNALPGMGGPSKKAWPGNFGGDDD